MTNKLPDDIKQQCLAIVRGHDRRLKWYNAERQNILNSSSAGYTNYVDNGVECRQYHVPLNDRISDIPYIKTLQLEKLDKSIKAQYIRIVENAKLNIGVGLNKKSREKLIKAIMLNCKAGRQFPYERLDAGKISRSAFFRNRDKFLYEIANCLQIV